MRRGSRFRWNVALCAIAFTGFAVHESAMAVLITAGIGFGMVVLFFPFRRALAVRSPELATEGHPELLEGFPGDTPLHLSEPSTNVHRVEG
jgi:hypothetical protein